MNKAPRKGRGLFRRVTIVTVSCIMLMLIVQMAMYLWMTDVTRDEVYSSASANAVYLCEQFEDSVSTVNTQIQYLLQSRDITSFFVYSRNYTYSEIISQAEEILGQLSIFRNSSPMIYEIRLYYPRYNIGFIANTIHKMVTPNGETLLQRIELTRSSSNSLQKIDDEFVISATSPTMIQNDGTIPAYYIEIVLDKDKMRSELSSFSSGQSRYTFQYNHAAQCFLFGTGDKIDASWTSPLAEAIEGADKAQIHNRTLVKLDNKDYTIITCYSPSLNITYGQLLATADLEKLPRSFQKYLFAFVALAILTILFLCWNLHHQVSLPMKALLDAFGITGKGHFEQRVSDQNYAWEFKALVRKFNDMNQQIQDLVITNYNHIINLQRAQLKQLQAQINPHFLYNSFFLLRQMIRDEDYGASNRFLGCMGGYFQYISENNSDTAMLSEEYDHAINYLTIQQTRFEDVLVMDIQPLNDRLKNVEVLRLTLQPLFENIMTHSKWGEDAQRIIRMRIVESDETIQIIVEDNGEGVTDENLRAVTEHLSLDLPVAEVSGLDNIHRRLRLHYGESGGLTICRSTLGGFSVTMTMPNTLYKGETAHE